MSAKKKRSSKRRKHKICNRGGHENALNTGECKSCKSKKFAPNWVVAKRAINRQVSVEITASNPKFGKSEYRLTLSKWWPGGRSTFHAPNVGQWEQIESIIQADGRAEDENR